MEKKGAAGNGEGGRIFNFRPALSAAAFFALGIAFAFFRLFSDASLWWLLALLPVPALAPLFFPADRLRSVAAAAGLLLCFSLGAFAFSAEVRAHASAEVISGRISVVGTVEEKTDYDWGARVILSDLTAEGKRLDGRLAATLPPSLAENIRLGDRAALYGEAETDLSFFGDYGFKSENVEKGIYYRMEAESAVAAGRSGNPFLFLRARLKDRLYAGMPEEAAGMTYALLIGDTSGIEEGLYENIRYGGISHIFSVSGLNVGALYAVMRAIEKRTALRRLPGVFRFALTGGLLALYAGVCGFSPSVLRAVVMCLVLYLSALFGVKSDLLESTGIAALVLLGSCPARLFDVGFGLSFAACLGIGVLSRGFSDGLQRALSLPARNADKPEGVWLRAGRGAAEFLAVTLSAQIGTLPLLAVAFGELSVWSVLLNCLFVPFTEALFFVLLALAFVACLLPASFAPALLFAPSAAWSASLLLFHALDFSLVVRTAGLQSGAAAFLGFFLFASDKVRLKRGARAAALLLCAAAFAASLVAWIF